jgi:hypothetical protein
LHRQVQPKIFSVTVEEKLTQPILHEKISDVNKIQLENQTKVHHKPDEKQKKEA